MIPKEFMMLRIKISGFSAGLKSGQFDRKRNFEKANIE